MREGEREREWGEWEGERGVTLVVLPCGVVEWRSGGAAILYVNVPASGSEAYCHNMTQTADILLFTPVKVHEECQH